MKIAIVTPVMVTVPPKKYGGIELIVDELARGLAKRGHDVSVFCAGGSKIDGKNLHRVESSPYPTGRHLEENRLWELHQLLSVLSRQNEFDIIHLNYEPLVCRFNADGINTNLLDFFTVPAVSTFHNTTAIPKNIKYYQDAHSLNKHTFVFVSENQRKRLSFFPRTKVIYNSVKIEQFSVERKKDDYLMFLGRIAPVKGIIEAIVIAQKTQIPLIIAGKIDPTDREFYEKKVKRLIDGKLIRYVGEKNSVEKVKLLKRAKCLLFPILWEEPFGLVMVEALACGTPVVAFRRGSVPEIIKNGVNGFIVNTIDEMAEAVKKIEKIDLSACRESVEKRFSVERMVGEYENLFKKIINDSKNKKEVVKYNHDRRENKRKRKFIPALKF